ncbi:MAG: hypothetical protein AN485_24245, partial [Anabaena sp. MDT14b]
AGDLWLEDVVDAGRAAADMALWHFAHPEACGGEQLFRPVLELLAMLHRAGGMVGHAQVEVANRSHFKGFHELADVHGEGRDAGRLPGIGRVILQHEAVILDRRAATRCRDEDGVEAGALDLGHPGVDVAPGGGMAGVLLAHMVHQRAAAAFAPG